MKRFKDNYSSHCKCGYSCECKCEPTFMPVQPNLTYTVADMYNAYKRGLPINNQVNPAYFDDGVPAPSWNIPMYQMRGVDPSDVWQAQMTARTRLSNGYKASKSKE